MEFLANAQNIVYVLIAFFIAVLGRKALQGRSPICNLAVTIKDASIYFAIIVSLSGLFIGNGHNSFLYNVSIFVIEGILTILMIAIANMISEKILLPNVDNKSAIEEGNVGIALVDSGIIIGTGFIIKGATSGSGPIWTSIVFFLLAQLAFIIMFKLYEAFTPFDDAKCLENENIACGVMFFGVLVSMSLILSSAVSGDDTKLLNDIVMFSIDTIKGIITMFAMFALVDLVVLPKVKLAKEIEKGNVYASVVDAAVKVSMASLISIGIV